MRRMMPLPRKLPAKFSAMPMVDKKASAPAAASSRINVFVSFMAGSTLKLEP